MKHTRSLLRTAAAALLCAALAPAAGAQQPGRHLLYRVQGPHGTVYLLGSIHLATSDLYPLPAAVDLAFADAEQVVFEVDLDSAAAIAPQMVARGRYPAGGTLRPHLSPATYALLGRTLPAYGMSAEQVAGLEPWLLALAVLPALELQKGAARAEHGLDTHLHRRAREAGKRRGALETAGFQIGLFDSMPAAEQDTLLRRTLEGLSRTHARLAALQAAVRAGDEARIAAAVEEETGAALRARLFTERNRRWVPQIRAMLRGRDDVLLVVGAGHLVGTDGVVARLRGSGHRVDRL